MRTRRRALRLMSRCALQLWPAALVSGRAFGVTNMVSLNLPLWLRFVLLVGVVGLVSGASLIAYRYYTHPVTLSVAVGSIDGEAAKAMSAISSRLVSTNAPVPLKSIHSGTVLEAADAFAAGQDDVSGGCGAGGGPCLTPELRSEEAA